MDITIFPGKLQGNVTPIPSKSQAHRYLICAAFANTDTTIVCPETNRDIEATADCLRALGAHILRTERTYFVEPMNMVPKTATLPCGESGSTLRFLLPIAGALGVDATFILEGRLPNRPLSPLWEEMERMGCTLSRPAPDTIRCRGQLRPGAYRMDGGVSSQYITGLMLAQCLMVRTSTLALTGNVESRPYIELTRQVISRFGGTPGGGGFHSPGYVTVEGDWSAGAFWLTAKALGCSLTVDGLNAHSAQGDRAVKTILKELTKYSTVDASDIPDLVPILAIFAAANQGAVFTGIRRLRLKESDRVASTLAMLRALGGRGEATENTLTVFGTGLTGGIVDACNDHRIAMSAAIAPTVCKENVTILGANCVCKSYPGFWEEYSRLGGKYEQYLR